MPYSARALGQDGLRLRSRRVRTARSQRLSVPLVATLVLLVMLVALIGFYGASMAGRELRLPSLVIPGWMPGPSVAPTPPQSIPDAVLLGPDADQQRYLDALLPIHSRLMQTVMRTGLAASAYGERDSDQAYFRSQIDDSLASYRRVEEDVMALQPPPDLRSSHDGYLATVRLFERSAVEMRKVYDDGDADHLAVGAPLSLEGMARMQVLSDRLWPK